MNNLSIKKRLVIVVLVVLVSYMVVFALFYRTMHINSELTEITNDIYEIEKDILILRKHEKDFIVRKDMKYRDSFLKVVEEIEIIIKNVQQFAQSEGVKAEELSRFDQTVENYKSVFLKYTESEKKMGLDPESGLYGALRDSVHDAENLVTKFDDEELEANILMLRRHEKDFMLRLNTKYIDAFEKSYITMVEDINHSAELDKNSKQEALNLIASYRKDFLALTEEQHILGFNETEGLQGEMRNIVHKTDTELDRLKEIMTSYLNGQSKSAAGFMYAVLVLASLITVVLAGLAANSVVNRIKTLNGLMREFSGGDADLTKQISFNGNDELVELSGYINKFVQNLRRLFIEVLQSAEKIADENSRIAATVEQFNATFSEQAMQTSSVAAAMEEMSASSANISDVISNMEDNTNSAKDKIKEGSRMLDKSIRVINDINAKTVQLGATVGSLASSSGQIGEIIDSINDIADQTNLLALNAAIEAARAGEAGRGFAVVADEVRKLAERTQSSIKEITAIISELKNETDKTSANMQEANEKVVEGVQTMNETGTVFAELVSLVDGMISSNNVVASSVSEQVNTVQEVSMNAQAISAGVEESAATVNEISASTGEMSHNAEILKDQMSRFKV